MVDISQQTIAQLLDHLDNADRELREARRIIRQIEEIKSEAYKLLPGIEGAFDGARLVAKDGQTYEVPSNYAAKSRLVYGDTLKMVEEDGKTMFKQINKVPRKKIEGILNKKEGSWYILTDSGSYKISDNAAEFSRAEINDEAIAIIPEAAMETPFAALDKILTQKAPSVPQMQTSNESRSTSPDNKRPGGERSSNTRQRSTKNKKPQSIKSETGSEIKVQASKAPLPKPVPQHPASPNEVTYTAGDDEDLR